MMRKIYKRRLARFRRVVDLQFVLVRQPVSYFAAKLTGVVFFPVFAHIGQFECWPFGSVQLLSLPDDLIGSLASAMQRVRAVVLCKLILAAVDSEASLSDSVAIAADQGTKVGCVADVVI